MTPRRWIEYLVAILLGNGIYFAVLHPALPGNLRHQPFQFDTGLVIDFVLCVLVYGAIRLGSRHAHARREDAASEARFGRSTDRASEKRNRRVPGRDHPP